MAQYPWLKQTRAGRPLAHATLQSRFAEPQGYARVAAEPGSFAHWLRTLPLAAPDTAVLDSSGKTTLASTAGFAAAVVAIDMHAEESADALLRLNAEWHFSRGDAQRISYLSNTGRPLPFSRWLGGERIVMKKQGWDWALKSAASTSQSYPDLRSFLDAAFQWVDPRALAIQGKVLGWDDVVAGDYFVHAGKEPTLVTVLDVAKGPKAEPALLLGHVAAPHQNMYVLRGSAQSAWFLPRATRDVLAPGLKPFVWKEHHRLPTGLLQVLSK
jgi:hypothetical protein